MPAVLSQNAVLLADAAAFADEVATVSSGSVQEEARQYAAYWAACIVEPRDQQASAWNVKSWFRRSPREERIPCPDCAEPIMKDAKVCRFCSYRFP